MVGDILRPEMFYSPQNMMVYDAISALYHTSQPIDIITVTNQLRKMGQLENVGGAFYISSLTAKLGSAANIEFHTRIIAEKFIRRELIRVANETFKKSYDETNDVFDLLDQTEDGIYQIAERSIKKNFEKMDALVSKAIKELEHLMNNKEQLSGLPSGFTDLDRLTAGWQKSNLIIVAARPGMGKTAFVLSMARNIAVDFKRPIALFSLEMSGVELVNRLISSETEIHSDKLKRGQLEPYEWEQLHHRVGKLSEAPIFIDDTPQLSILELRTKCRRLKSKFDIECIIIDYLQLMTANSDNRRNTNREQEISTISRELKGLAKELGIPVIALSQLSREVEKRPEKRPQLSDLRESGAIEQDADMVMFIFRPEYYKIDELPEFPSTKGLAQLLIEKHRNGETGTVNLRFLSRTSRFADWDNFSSGSFSNNATMTPGGMDNGMLPMTKIFGSKANEDIDDTNSEDAPF
jgi:replicative DNA helicase